MTKIDANELDEHVGRLQGALQALHIMHPECFGPNNGTSGRAHLVWSHLLLIEEARAAADKIEALCLRPARINGTARPASEIGFATELDGITDGIVALILQLHCKRVENLDSEQIASLDLLGEQLKLIGQRISEARRNGRPGHEAPPKRGARSSHAV